VGEEFLQSRSGMFGIATVGKEACLGLGTELVTARTVEGALPRTSIRFIPKKRPLFHLPRDPKILAETLLAMADLLPTKDRASSSSTTATACLWASAPGTRRPA